MPTLDFAVGIIDPDVSPRIYRKVAWPGELARPFASRAELRQVFTGGVEDLDSTVAAVGHIEVPGRIGPNAPWR